VREGGDAVARAVRDRELTEAAALRGVVTGLASRNPEADH
jgi:hypothetical protein